MELFVAQNYLLSRRYQSSTDIIQVEKKEKDYCMWAYRGSPTFRQKGFSRPFGEASLLIDFQLYIHLDFHACVQLNIRTLHIILKYVIYLYDLREGDSNAVLNWEKRGPIAYYAELIFELTVLLLDFLHHIHMLLWSNIFLSIASLVICMQLRHLFHEIQRRIKKHRNYLWVLNHMEQNYPLATAEELMAHKDNCAICWEEMDNARKLPCGHLFHNSCLQSWLEQDTSCPTCRTVLSVQSRHVLDAASRLEQMETVGGNRRMPNHFFHFDGSRYVSWLPSFSLEVTHLQLSPHQLPVMQNFQIDVMVRQVQQLFPHIPATVIADDLRISRSVELTIENILDGRVVVPVVPERTQPESQTVSAGESVRTGSSFLVESSSSLTGISKCKETSIPSGTFSSSSVEREKILQKRKEQMILAARGKYLSRNKRVEGSSETGNS
ncbi:hypothetical protein RUM43_004084 [Polyplax serrata]|uniref:Autocrine motility factor receptor n=1 Tax=Polyplax serrata TaxID=468196 RepID=A0AAN8XPA7_POLSC